MAAAAETTSRKCKIQRARRGAAAAVHCVQHAVELHRPAKHTFSLITSELLAVCGEERLLHQHTFSEPQRDVGKIFVSKGAASARPAFAPRGCSCGAAARRIRARTTFCARGRVIFCSRVGGTAFLGENILFRCRQALIIMII